MIEQTFKLNVADTLSDLAATTNKNYKSLLILELLLSTLTAV